MAGKTENFVGSNFEAIVQEAMLVHIAVCVGRKIHGHWVVVGMVDAQQNKWLRNIERIGVLDEAAPLAHALESFQIQVANRVDPHTHLQ